MHFIVVCIAHEKLQKMPQMYYSLIVISMLMWQYGMTSLVDFDFDFETDHLKFSLMANTPFPLCLL